MIYLVIETDYSDDSKVSAMKAFEHSRSVFDYLWEKEAEGDVNYVYELLPMVVVKG